MGREDLYRRSSWSAQDQSDFEARLKRARSSVHKAQYLRIQAHYLDESGDIELTSVALSLLDRVLREYPTEERALTRCQRGECLVHLGRPLEALLAFREALAVQRENPGVISGAALNFAELVVALNRRDLFDEALEALAEHQGTLVFPAQVYRTATVRALIAVARGELADARHWANLALAAAARTDPPLGPRRPYGLVRGVDPLVFERLRVLAGAT